MSELLPEPKARRPSASILSEPLLANRNKINDKVIIKKKDTSFIDKYFGTDTQKACFFMALTAIIYNIDTLIRLIIQHFGDRIDLIIYMIGLTLISYGGYKGYICSSSSNILNKSFYMPGQSIHPLKDNWFNIHLGTGLLVSSQSILLGSVIYLLASITQLIESPFIHITYSYSSSICNIIGGILIVISSYYNNIATYPENMLRPFDPKIVEYLENNNKQWLIRHIGTDMQMAAWSLTITSIVWFIISAITFDYFTSSSFDNYLTPLLNVICSILLGISSYYSLRQSYNEGTKFDTLLVNVFNNNKEDSQQEEDDDHNGIIYDLENGGHSGDRSLYNNNEAAAAVAAVVQEEEQHPLKNINNRDIIGLVDMQDVINESYLFINNNNWYCDDNIDEEPVIHRLTTNINNKIHNNTSSIDNNYISQNEGIYDDNNGEGDNNIIVPPPGIESITETTKIWYYHNNNNTVKCSDILNGVEALLVAAILQSKEFKLSVIGDSDIGRVSLIDEPDGKTFIYYERHPPDPPMPLCESTYCSHIGIPKDDNNEEEDSLILVEWGCIASSSSQYDNNKVIVNNNSSIVNPKVARINPYRVYYLTSLPNGKTKITTALYITIPSYHHKHNNTTLSSSPPQFLINEELRKAPEIFADLKIFLNDEESMGHVIGDLEFRIWQDIHRKITPLLSGVLVRASPAYRAMIASFPGLRANVPHSLYIHRYNNNRQGEEEDNEHPLYNTPLTLNDAITNDGILKACSIGMEFISNDYEDWILNNNNNIIHNPFNSKKQETGRRSFKLNTWRRKLKGETIDPYRIQCKSQGIDPLTLATIWWSNEGNFRIVNKDYTGIESIKDITSSSSITAVIGEGMVNNIKIYNEILKGHGTMRKRECGIISILKELSATKVMVIDYSINDIPNNINNKSLSSLVHVNIFNVYLFENDSGANTKITIAGLVPCGGKTEKLLKIMAEKEVKLQEHFMTFIYNYFTDTSQGRTLVTNTRNKILGEVWQPVLSGLSKLELQFLRANSDAFNMLVNEDNHINNNNTIEHVQQVQQQQGLNLRNKSETAASSSSTTRIEAHKSNIKMTPRRIRSRQITSIIKTEDDNEIRKDKVCNIM